MFRTAQSPKSFRLLSVFALVAMGLLASCQNFEYTHPVCAAKFRVDLPNFGDGKFFQTTTSYRIFSGDLDMSFDDYQIKRVDLGVYEDARGEHSFVVCKIGERILVEKMQESRRQIFQFDTLEDGFLLTSMGVPLKTLEASAIPFKKVNSETVVANEEGIVWVNPDLVGGKEAGEELLVDTSDAANAEKFAKILIPSSDSKRFYRGPRRKK